MRTLAGIVVWLALPVAAWWLVLVGGGWAAVALLAAFALCLIAVAAIAALYERRTWDRMDEVDDVSDDERARALRMVEDLPVWTRTALYDHEVAGDFR